MVTQGQGLSKRDFENVVEGAKLVAEHTNLKRCASIGHMSVKRAKALKEAGIQRVHHNVETAESYYPEVSTTVRYEGRLRTIDAVEEAGLETCVGGILNLGESREQRVEMAFQLAKIDPTSVPINMLNPRPGTKFGDRDFMDPWETVKWIAIFRLILPAALFRLCGGRVENLGELQQLAVKAGINGVMMGNFLTTLGNEPEEDRAMFEELGLNVARQDDNGANPRPDNRSGWLEGEAPRTPIDDLVDRQEEAPFWNPERQLRRVRKSSVPPRPDGAPNVGSGDHARADQGRGGVTDDIEAALEDLRDRGLYRRMRMVSGPQGPRVLLDGKPVLLLCSNNYLGLADHPRVREAAAEASMRYGAGAGASRLVSGTMRIHRRLEERLAEFKGYERSLLFGSGYLANVGTVQALARKGEVVFSDALNHASIVDGCRLAGAETFVYDHADLDHLAWGLEQAQGRGSLIATDGVFSMDGDVAPLEGIVELAREHDVRVMVDDAHGTGTLGPGGRGTVAAAGLEDEVDVLVGTLSKSLRVLRRLCLLRAPHREVPGEHGAHADLLHRPAASGRRRRDGRARAAAGRAAAGGEGAAQLVDPARGPQREGAARTRRHHPGDTAGDRRRRGRRGRHRTRARAGSVRPGHPPAHRARGHLATAPHRDGVAHQGGACERRRARSRRRCRRTPERRWRATPSRRSRRPTARACSTASPPEPDPRRCADSSSPAPTPASASRCWPRRSAPRWCGAASAWRRSSRWSPAPTTHPGRWPPDHELLARRRASRPIEVTPRTFGPAVSPHLAAAHGGGAAGPGELWSPRARAAARAPTFWSARAWAA